MKELSMHILDIVMNSVKAQARLIEVEIEDSIKKNILKITIKDNGKGMNEEILNNVVNPFFTTRNTRKVGLGLPMLKEACERCNGDFNIFSELGKGTTVIASFERNNIDRAPLGSIGVTIMTIINSLENCELIYYHKTDKNSFQLNTSQIKEILDGVDIKSNEIMLWLKEYVDENIKELY